MAVEVVLTEEEKQTVATIGETFGEELSIAIRSIVSEYTIGALLVKRGCVGEVYVKEFNLKYTITTIEAGITSGKHFTYQYL